MYICILCGKDLNIRFNTIFNPSFTIDSCYHKFCALCLKKRILLQIAKYEIPKCPKSNCQEKIHDYEIKALVNEDCYKQYLSIKFPMSGYFVKCIYCNTINDSNTLSEDNSITCKTCDTTFCSKCLMSHEDEIYNECQNNNEIINMLQELNNEECSNNYGQCPVVA